MTITRTRTQAKTFRDKPAPQRQIKMPRLPHNPNYIYLCPPGEMLEEKMFELGWDKAEAAQHLNMSAEVLEQLIRAEIPLTQELADKIETATMMHADFLMRMEKRYREKYVYAMQHPEIPAYFGKKIINKPKKAGKKSE